MVRKANKYFLFIIIFLIIVVIYLLFIMEKKEAPLKLISSEVITDSSYGIISKVSLQATENHFYVCWSANIDNKFGDDQICIKEKKDSTWLKPSII
jgi:hypothetical protein